MKVYELIGFTSEGEYKKWCKKIAETIKYNSTLKKWYETESK